MMRSARRCVQCGAQLRPEDIPAAGPFPCPTCRTRLQAPNSYAGWIGLGCLLFPAAVLRAFGVGGLHLLITVLLLWLPIDYLALSFSRYVVPPKIQIYLPRDTALNLHDGQRK